MYKRNFALLVLLTCGIAASSYATDITLDGSVSYETSGSSLTLNADSISNNASGGNSGSMSWTLWATSSRYSGGSISGYILGEYFFDDVLNGGYYYNEPSVTVSYTEPPDGTYYITMTLNEWDGSDYVIRDYVTFDETETWGSGGGNPVTETPGGFPNAFDIGGGWFYTETFGSYYYAGSGWYYSSWLGSFYADYTSISTLWIYSVEVEWCYVSASSTASDQFWTYLVNYGTWCLTNDSLFPTSYLNGIGWTVYDSDVGDFYNPESGGYINGNVGGGANSVDYIITNTGGLDQATWNQTVQQLASTIGSGNGYTQVEYSSTRFVLRFTSDDASLVQSVRQGWQSLVGDYGGFIVSVE